MDWFVKSFASLFSIKEKSDFNEFKKTQGTLELDRYLEDISLYFSEVDILSAEDIRKEQFKIIAQGMRLRLPDLELYAHRQYAETYPVGLKQICFNYMLGCMEAKSQQVLLNPEHLYWHQVEYLANEIITEASSQIELSLFLIHLFNKTIQFHKNALGVYLLSQNPLLKNMGIRECHPQDPHREGIEHKTPLFMALFHQNLHMLTALKAQSAEMNPDDIKSLQALLLHLVTHRDERHFAFILRHYPSIIKVEGFHESLIKACDEQGPMMTKVIKEFSEPRARRHSFYISTKASETMTTERLKPK
jgi:hypothetical protein